MTFRKSGTSLAQTASAAIGSTGAAMTTSQTLHGISRATTQDELLRQLKDLKNSVIGNTWRKVEVAEDERLLEL